MTEMACRELSARELRGRRILARLPSFDNDHRIKRRGPKMHFPLLLFAPKERKQRFSRSLKIAETQQTQQSTRRHKAERSGSVVLSDTLPQVASHWTKWAPSGRPTTTAALRQALAHDV